MNKFVILFLFLIIILSGCSKDKKEVLKVKEQSQELEMMSAYNEAYISLDRGDTFFAANKFLEAELLYPQSEWAPKAALMASYSYYLQNYFTEAILNLERYLKTYPEHKNTVYGHYLIGMCYFESIENEKKDSGSILKAKEKFTYILNTYPSSEFAIDANFKINLINDVLASKEMYLGRHYIKKKKWIAAINRFKTVITEYDQTIFVEEALHRLVEINYNLGLINESQKYAKILGYNYLSSEWYKRSYKIFNQDYSIELNNVIKDDKKGVFNKFKKLF